MILLTLSGRHPEGDSLGQMEFLLVIFSEISTRIHMVVALAYVAINNKPDPQAEMSPGFSYIRNPNINKER